MGRRRFLSAAPGILIVGAGALSALATLTPGCEADEETFALLIAATLVAFAAGAATYYRSEDVGGTIELKNDTTRDASGEVALGLLDSSDQVVDRGRAYYDVPAGYVNVYEWNGLQSQQAGEHRARAETATNSMDSEPFQIAE